YNSILWGNYLLTGVLGNCDGVYDFRYTCVSPLYSGTGNINSDPRFVDAGSGDYRLLADSPCINVGSSSYVNGSLDIFGNVRVQDGTVDMGCYEGAFSAVDETQTTPVPVPYIWLDGYSEILALFGGNYEAMANSQSPGNDGKGKVWSDGSAYYLWQDYVVGTDPMNTNSVFKAKIDIVDGEPIITWEPDTPELRTTRVYRILGKKSLLDKSWLDITEKDRSEYHFFKVTVDLPCP
ncbi:MAG: hypothetical protein IJU44_04875, partial [Kiritimatiellae bacterium]|nr:hypothetical protein [Kiritimatiellia bacterium]